MRIVQRGPSFLGHDVCQPPKMFDDSLQADLMALELAQRARRIAGEIGGEGLKPGFLLGGKARQLLDGFRLGPTREGSDQLADLCLGLAFGFGKYCWRLLL